MLNENFKPSACELTIEDFPLIISEKARQMASRATRAEANPDFFLRVSIKGGGCAGLQYNLDIDDKPSAFDVNCSFEDLKVAVDIFSLHYLANTTIDHQESLEVRALNLITRDARKTCGCGSSFSN